MHPLQSKYGELEQKLTSHIGTEAKRFDHWRPPDYKERLQRIDDALSLNADRADFLEGYFFNNKTQILYTTVMFFCCKKWNQFLTT